MSSENIDEFTEGAANPATPSAPKSNEDEVVAGAVTAVMPVADEGTVNSATPNTSEDEPEKRASIWVNRALLIVGVLLIAAGAVLGLMQLLRGDGYGDLVDMNGNQVVPDLIPSNNEEWMQQSDLQEIAGARFIVDSVSLNVPYGEVNEVDGVLNPPNFRGVFRVRNRGVDLPNASKGTVYLVTHSLRMGGYSPGNYLMNIWNKTWSLNVGDIISVNGTRYVADDYLLVDNTNLGSRPELWVNEPGRLVLITCMQYTDQAASRENLIILAHLEGFTKESSAGVTVSEQPTTTEPSVTVEPTESTSVTTTESTTTTTTTTTEPATTTEPTTTTEPPTTTTEPPTSTTTEPPTSTQSVISTQELSESSTSESATG
ncbi:MAG: hypothetical protein LBJ43_04715 [Propionibacteriaceae bacterium]|jgi:hypothetical protein|nr:hypothetical protein [Propionibacteriaceae bacterium]